MLKRLFSCVSKRQVEAPLSQGLDSWFIKEDKLIMEDKSAYIEYPQLLPEHGQGILQKK